MVSSRLVIVLFATIAITAAASLPNDLIIGSSDPQAHLIQRESIKHDASKIGKIVTVTKTFNGNNFSKITMVRALDQHRNGHGATARLISGGLGQAYVTLKFESERFRSIDFVVEVYGK